MPTCRSAPPLPGSCPARYGSVIIQLESQFCYRASFIATSKRSDSVTMCELLVDGWLVLIHGALQNKTTHSNGNVRRKQPSKGSSGNFLKRRYISGNIREWVKFLVHGFSHRHILTDSDRFCYGYSPHQPLPKVMGSIPSLHHVAHQHLCQLGPSHATLGFGYRAGLVARCRCHDVMGKRRKKIIEDVMAEFPCLVRLPGGSCCRASEILLHHLSHIWASRSLIDCLSMSWKNLCASTQHKTGSKIFNSHNSAPNFHQVKMPPMLGWFPLCGPHHLWWPRSHFARIYQPHRRVVPNIT